MEIILGFSFDSGEESDPLSTLRSPSPETGLGGSKSSEANMSFFILTPTPLLKPREDPLRLGRAHFEFSMKVPLDYFFTLYSKQYLCQKLKDLIIRTF